MLILYFKKIILWQCILGKHTLQNTKWVMLRSQVVLCFCKTPFQQHFHRCLPRHIMLMSVLIANPPVITQETRLINLHSHLLPDIMILPQRCIILLEIFRFGSLWTFFSAEAHRGRHLFRVWWRVTGFGDVLSCFVPDGQNSSYSWGRPGWGKSLPCIRYVAKCSLPFFFCSITMTTFTLTTISLALITSVKPLKFQCRYIRPM